MYAGESMKSDCYSLNGVIIHHPKSVYFISIFMEMKREKNPSFFFLYRPTQFNKCPHIEVHIRMNGSIYLFFCFSIDFFNRKPYVYRALSFNQKKTTNRFLWVIRRSTNRPSEPRNTRRAVFFLCSFVNTFATILFYWKFVRFSFA